MTPDGSGPSSLTPFAFFDPDGCSSKMWMVCDLWGWQEFSQTWPQRFMTVGGRAYELPTWERHMGARASSSSPLLRTPDASSGQRQGDVKLSGRTAADPQVSLHDQVRLLKTPTSNLGSNGGSQHPDKRKDGRARTVELLTTAPPADTGIGITTPTGTARSAAAVDAERSGPNRQPSRTPTTTDTSRQGRTTPNGATTSPPSAGGKPSSEGQLPLP